MPFAPTRRKKHRARRPKEMSLQITSLIDVFTILLVFLLKSYATEGHLIQLADSIRLPTSTARQELNPSVSVAFDPNSLYVDGQLLIPDLRPYAASDDLLIEPLYRALESSATRLKQVARVNPGVVFTGEIVIQSDREVPFRLLKKVIFTAGQAEYVNQSLAVVQED